MSKFLYIIFCLFLYVIPGFSADIELSAGSEAVIQSEVIQKNQSLSVSCAKASIEIPVCTVKKKEGALQPGQGFELRIGVSEEKSHLFDTAETWDEVQKMLAKLRVEKLCR